MILKSEPKKLSLEGLFLQIKIEDDLLLNALENKILSALLTNSYKTNVIGKMTSYEYFVQDNDFKKLLSLFYAEAIKDNLFSNFPIDKGLINIKEAWGNILEKNEYVKKHIHYNQITSCLYFDDNSDLHTKEESFKTFRGLILSIPGCCPHWVEPVKDKKRISLIWNWSFQ